MSHPNARERKTYPALSSDVTASELVAMIEERFRPEDRIVFFRVKGRRRLLPRNEEGMTTEITTTDPA